ncbi:lycopene cyclase domain-containing protein [Microbacterium sp. G2-8]|uniref:lycopene cyclase domain-containing protein n=1 Tax=Microbacterium sp. G2-8 TaxID=2842454 RepID=UPI001C8A9E5D|nr:lycopene cyclase domain-containing protein [Microbacterium sp. G2-8]
MSAVYAIALLVSAACIGLVDARYRLAFGRAPVRTGLALGIGIVFFLAWDAVGIAFGVFRHLDSRWATGVLLAPQFPLEELLFVSFLTYLTLVLLGGWQRLTERSETR